MCDKTLDEVERENRTYVYFFGLGLLVGMVFASLVAVLVVNA